MQKSIVLLMACMLFLPVARYVYASGYEDTIPPEILKQYDPAILKNVRPKLVRITQPMIFSLRNKPDQGGDVYCFNFDVDKISTSQKQIIQAWVRNGQKILLWGKDDAEKYWNLFDDELSLVTPQSGWDDSNPQLSRHPVNTDIANLDFSYLWDVGVGMYGVYHYRGFSRFTNYPTDAEVVVSTSDGIMAGRFPYGNGSIYVALMSGRWDLGRDKDRWTLNFRQWMLGFKVPGAIEATLPASQSESALAEPQDRILLKNGDTVSGHVVNDKLSIKRL